MQIKNRGMRVEFCCEKMKTAVLGSMVDIMPKSDSQVQDQVRIGLENFPLAGEHRYIDYCPYCGAKVIFEKE